MRLTVEVKDTEDAEGAAILLEAIAFRIRQGYTSGGDLLCGRYRWELTSDDDEKRRESERARKE